MCGVRVRIAHSRFTFARGFPYTRVNRDLSPSYLPLSTSRTYGCTASPTAPRARASGPLSPPRDCEPWSPEAFMRKVLPAFALGLLALELLSISGSAQVVVIDPPTPPPSLKTVLVPKPIGIEGFVK